MNDHGASYQHLEPDSAGPTTAVRLQHTHSHACTCRHVYSICTGSHAQKETHTQVKIQNIHTINIQTLFVQLIVKLADLGAHNTSRSDEMGEATLSSVQAPHLAPFVPQ